MKQPCMGLITPNYFQNIFGNALNATSDITGNSVVEGISFIYNTASESMIANFNAQLGRIMAGNNYPSGYSFYVQPVGIGLTTFRITSYNGKELGYIDAWKKYFNNMEYVK